jgi:hypothetical protein
MCPGDCDGNGTVSADEIQSAIRLTMACATPSVACAEARELEDCPAADIDQDGLMRASELTRIVSNSTIFPNGCPP